MVTERGKIRNRGLAVSQMRASGEPGCQERKGLAWLGIPGGDYAAAVRFFGETVGLEVAFDAGNTVALAARNGDRIQLSGPGHRYFESCRNHGDRIVPLLEVDDLDQASAELARGGAELLGRPDQTAPGPGSPSRCPTGTSIAWAPAWRSWQVRRLWSNSLDMRPCADVAQACSVAWKRPTRGNS
jgi:predicted enzyme related to lactoylglutathione lyase